MSFPQVAIIIATKNRPVLLQQRALNSVLKQSKLPNYLVIVDDSSEHVKPQNKLLVDSIPPTNFHIQYLTNQRTKGASGAWNTAIEYLSGEKEISSESLFLAFIDDDDEWHPNYLNSCLTVAITNHCNMVAAGFYRYENDKEPPIECLPPKSLHEDLFLRGNPGIQGSNLFLSLDIILKAGAFDEQLKSCTDRDLCIRICDLGIVRYSSIDKPLLNHYAENERQRLSTPNSSTKNEGLACFWQKYHGRMSNIQRKKFLERALFLFSWKPEKLTKKTINNKPKVGLTLGLELGNTSFTELSKVIKRTHQISQHYLVGFNLVLTTVHKLNFNYLHKFIELVSQLGINCYNFCEQQACIETTTLLVAKGNVDHSAWVIKEWQPPYLVSNESNNVVSRVLIKLGARRLYNESLNEQLKNQNLPLFQKIKQCRIDTAHVRIKKLFSIHHLQLLGTASEAVVMTDGGRVYKYIDSCKNLMFIDQIKLLQKKSSQWNDLPGLYTLDEVISDGWNLVISYPYQESSPYQGGNVEQVINLLHSCSKAGIVCNNIHPKNLIKIKNEVKLIDYGMDIRPWNELGFEHMARRAYLTIYHADHPQLKELMRKSLREIDFSEMQGYQVFRQRLSGIDCNLKQEKEALLPIEALTKASKPFNLIVGVITGDAYKLLPLLNGIAELASCSFLSQVDIIVLCNGCSESDLKSTFQDSKRSLGSVRIINEVQQIEDAKAGMFGPDLVNRPHGQVGIARARSMLQKYVGLKCITNEDSIAWILDDDMRIDARAKQYLAWLPIFKKANIDVLIGQYEGSSPNPPLNGLRGQLVDLLHNLCWLEKLPNNVELPDRSCENTILRNKYPDYYYDLSRKHTAHIEAPFWLEPSYVGETVGEAHARLLAYAPLLSTGFPLTRGIIPTCTATPLATAKDTVNRGGNTFVLNPKALIQTPNLIPKVNGREMRRSDMIWAMINKHHHGLNIKSVPFPVQHIGRVKSEQKLDLDKVQDEIMGSSLYAGLQDFFNTNEQHNLVFTTNEMNDVWLATIAARNSRLERLSQSFHRINGLAKALSKYSELTELCEYLTRSFNPSTMIKLEAKVKEMNQCHIHEFLNQIVPQSIRFAKAHEKTVETIE